MIERDALTEIEESARALIKLIDRDVDPLWNADAAALSQIAHHIQITAEAGLASLRQPQKPRTKAARKPIEDRLVPAEREELAAARAQDRSNAELMWEHGVAYSKMMGEIGG